MTRLDKAEKILLELKLEKVSESEINECISHIQDAQRAVHVIRTLRDEFAKNAPLAPEWFVAQEKMNYASTVELPEPDDSFAHTKIKDFTNDQQACYDAWIEECQRIKTKELLDQNEKIFFQWRWHYADMMLKTR